MDIEWLLTNSLAKTSFFTKVTKDHLTGLDAAGGQLYVRNDI